MPGETPKVVFVNHWARRLGGAEYSLLGILSYAPKHSRACLVTSEEGPLTHKAREAGIACRVIPCGLKPGKNIRGKVLRTLFLSCRGVFSYLHFIRLLSRFVKEEDPDIMHANVPLSHLALFLLVWSGYRGRCVFHVREIFKKHSLPYFLYGQLFPKKRGTIIAISESVKQNLPPILSRNAVVIYNGVSVPFALPLKKPSPESAVRFLYLGRVVPWKGCLDLIMIFSQANDCAAQGSWSLSLVGDTSYWSDKYRRQLQDQIRSKGLESKCMLLPHTNDPVGVLRAHDIFVNASYLEPFGRSIAEAQAQGLPVVAFDSGGIREIVEHEKTGLLIPYNDMEGFAKAVVWMIENSEAGFAMGERGHDRAKRCFNEDIQVPKIWGEIMKKQPRDAGTDQ
jgi:glycosyltransferase involved in cell wall biosynthesis